MGWDFHPKPFHGWEKAAPGRGDADPAHPYGNAATLSRPCPGHLAIPTPPAQAENPQGQKLLGVLPPTQTPSRSSRTRLRCSLDLGEVWELCRSPGQPGACGHTQGSIGSG